MFFCLYLFVSHPTAVVFCLPQQAFIDCQYIDQITLGHEIIVKLKALKFKQIRFNNCVNGHIMYH